MSLLVKAHREGREIVRVTPQSAGWKYVGFTAFRLAPGERQVLDLAGREICIVVLSGRVNVDTGAARFDGIGGRASVFDDRGPYAVYAPDGAGVTIEALTPAEIGVASAPGGGALPPRLIEPSTMQRSVRGQGANTRYVRDILPQTAPAEPGQKPTPAALPVRRKKQWRWRQKEIRE